MSKKHYIMIAAVFLVCALSRPNVSDAGVLDVLSKAKNWWSSSSIAAKANSAVASDENKASDSPAANHPDGMCSIPQEPARIVCETGSADFLCVNTPDGGVAGDKVLITGVVDRKNSIPASIRIVTQSEYTKKTVLVDTSKPVGGDCWSGKFYGSPFCFSEDGRFSALVPLSIPGPYTISVSASRLSGSSIEKNVRMSRVIPLKLDTKNVKFDPDVAKNVSVVDGSNLLVTVDLLGDCQFCDFIGASTGGVKVTVENLIKDSNGSKRISCTSSVEQGGQGKFAVGVPVGRGTNNLTIRACNAALTEGECQKITGISFKAKGDTASLTTISPPPAPSYDMDEYPDIPWIFSLGDFSECVKVRFNREAPQKVCPSKSGHYLVDLKPKVGINIATISRSNDAQEFAWTFGWGRIRSPFGSTTGAVEVADALNITLPSRTMGNNVIPLINNFLKSDEFKKYIENLFSPTSSVTSGRTVPAQTRIPHCTTGDDEYTPVLRNKPVLESAELAGISFRENNIDLWVMLKGLSIGLNLFSKGDDNPIPVNVGLKAAKLNLTLNYSKDEQGRTLLLLSSPDSDCSYKGEGSCDHRPASLVPKNFAGNVNSSGAFAECDTDAATGAVWLLCVGANAIDYINDKVLDAVNKAIYCSASASLTDAARNGVSLPDNSLAGFVPSLSLPLAVKLGDKFSITESGLTTSLDFIVGNENSSAKTPEQFRVKSAGFISDENKSEMPVKNPLEINGDLMTSLSLDAVNAILYASTSQGDGVNSQGLFDLDIHELFFKELGFDFVKECDDKSSADDKPKEPSALCLIRPRVGELLGTSLTTYGYFHANPKWPLLLAVRGNRALGPRIAVVNIEDVPLIQGEKSNASAGSGKKTDEDVPTGSIIALELGGINLSFYVLDVVDPDHPVDEYQNLEIKKDVNGKPVILSMRPEDPDPLNGAIASFDMTLLLVLEVGDFGPDPSNPSNYLMSVRTLANRSRLSITPVAGSNSTTVPVMGIISPLAEQMNLAIGKISSRSSAVSIPIPKEIAVGLASAGSENIFGLQKLWIGPRGLTFDEDSDSVQIVIQEAITQILHENGQEKERRIP